MADVNANISIGIDTTNAAAQLKNLEAQLSDFNNRVIASNQKAIAAQRQALALLQSKIGDTGAFSTEIRNVESSVSRFSKSLEKGKLSFGEYFRYGLASTKKFGRAFDQELATIEGLAEDRVKRLSTRYISLGQDINGVHKALAISPNQLGDGMETRLALAAQKQQIFNQLLKQGSTHLVNWGKNTQWAGRQLMVGFTVPLTIFGGVAMKVFSDLEKQTIAFQRVYGDLNTTVAETDAMTQQVKGLAAEFTKYGISVTDTMKLAADAAATGAQGADLISQTTQATRLATLGQMDQQEALKSTIALQNAFKMSNDEVAQSINFLNAVENQTVVSLSDITQAIPRVAPVIKGLGGDVQDLAVFMAAMQEGGVGAAEAANALKSGLAALINPSKDAKESLKGVGIDLDKIVNTNRGDLMGTVTGFAEALQTLDKTAQQQVLAKVFGKYQFARLGALFDNITKSGSQASRVMDLAGMSVTDLANLSDKELGKIENAVSVKFQASIEKLKLAIAPIGEMFMKIATPVIDAATKILEVFNSMPDGVKTAVTVIVGLFAGIAPVFLMGVGLIANGMGNLIKGFSALRSGYQRMVGMVTGGNNPLTQSFGYLSQAELDAIAAGQGLDGQLSQTTNYLLIQASAVDGLANAYKSLIGTMASAQAVNPQGFSAPMARRGPRRMATGGFVGGRGNEDNQPALLMPGEFVVNKKAAEQYGPILAAMNAGKLPGLAEGSQTTRYLSGNAGVVQSHIAGATPGEFGGMLKGIVEAADQLGKFGKGLADSTTTLYRLQDAENNNYTIIKEENVAIKDFVASIKEGSKVATPFYKGTMQPSMGKRNELFTKLPSNPGEPIMADQLFALEQEVIANRENLVEYNAEIDQIIAEADQLRRAMQESEDADLKYAESKIAAMLEAEQLRTRGVTAEEAKITATAQAAEIIAEMKGIYTREGKSSTATALAHKEAIAGLQFFANASSTAGEEIIIAGDRVSQNALRDVATQRTRGPGEGATFAEPRRTNPTAKGVAPGGAGIIRYKAQEWEALGTQAGIIAGQNFNVSFEDSLAKGSRIAGESIRPNVLDGADAASPPPWSRELGMWIGQGIQQGMDEVNLSASQMRGAHILGGAGGTSQSAAVQQSTEALAVANEKAAIAAEKDAIATTQDAMAHEKDAIATQNDAKQKKGGAAGMGKFLYAIDGLSLAMSFLPGPLGDIANKIFIASAALSALDAIIRVDLIRGAITQLLKALNIVRVKQVANVAGDVIDSVPLPGKIAKAAPVAGGAAAAAEAALAASAGEAAAATGAMAAGSTAAAEGAVAAGAASSALALEMTPVGWAITAVVAALALLTSAAMPFVLTYKNAGDKIRDLGDAAELTKDQLSSLAGEFGFTQQKTGFEQPITSAGNTVEARTTAQQARDYIANNPDMQEKSRVIGQATDQEAAATIRAMFSNLIASGAPKEVATSIIEAVAQEAGKQHVFLPVKADLQASFNDEGKIKDIGKYIEGQLSPAIKDVQAQIDKFGTKGFSAVFDQKAVDEAKKTVAALSYIPEALRSTVNPQYDQAKAVLETAKNFDLLKTSSQSAMNLLSSQFVNGQITLDEFNKGMGQIETSLNGLGQPQALAVMQQQLVDLYPASINGAKGITDAADAMKVLQLAASGYDMGGFMAQISAAGAMTETFTAQLSTLYSLMGQTNAARDKISKLEQKRAAWIAKHTTGGGTGGSGGGTPKDPFADRENALRNQQAEITIKEIKIDRKAEGMFDQELDKRFGKKSITIDGLKLPLQSISDAEYAIGQIGEKIDDIQNGPMQDLNDQVDKLNKEEAVYQKQLDAINHDIEIQQQHIAAIERQYKPILDSLNEQKDLHQSLLDQLQEEQDAQTRPIEDRIYELEKQQKAQQQIADQQTAAIDAQVSALDDQLSKIDEQEAALQKVADVNQYILDQQKRQIGLAEALSTGDVYAAAQAQQEMQAASTQNAQDMQKQAFQQQKDEINKKKDAYDKEKQLIQDSLDAIQKQIDAQEYQKFLIEDSYRLRVRSEQDALAAAEKAIAAAEKQRDAQIAPYQAIIDNYAPQIETLNNSIWAKQQAIKTIQDEQLAPLQDQVTKLERQKTLLEDIKGDVETAVTKEKQGLENRKKYLDQELQILQAKREIADLPTGGGGGGGISSTKVPKTTPFDKAIAKAQANLDNLQTQVQEILDKFGKGPEEQSGWQTFLDNIWPDNWDFLMPDLDWAGMWKNIASSFVAQVVNPIKSAWSGITSWFKTNIISPINNAWASVTGFVSRLWDNVFQPIAKAVAAIATAITQLLGEAFSAVWDKVTQVWGAFSSWFNSTVIQPVIGAWNTVVGWIGTNIIEPIKTLWSTIISWYTSNIIEPIKNMWITIATWFDSNIIQPIKNMWTTITTWFNLAIIQPIKNAWNSIITWFNTTIIQPIKDMWSSINTWINDHIITPLKTAWTNFVEWTKKPFNDMVEDVKAFFKAIPDVIAGFISSIPDKFAAIVGNEDKGTGVLGVVGKIKTWFMNLPTTIAGAFSNIATTIGNTLKGVLNGIIDIWNGFQLEIGQFSIGPKTFGPWTLGMPDLPRFATGGVVGSGGSDSVLSKLTPGEFVVRKSMVDKYGEPMFKAINQGSFGMPNYAVPSSKTGSVDASSVSSANINAPVYNTYSINIPVTQPNASADDIANKVMMKIKNVDNSSIRRINGY